MKLRYSLDDHLFVLCAYGKSPYIEECIASLENQTMPSKIIICTATPSDYLSDIARQHELEILVNRGAHGIAEDWNFAYAQANASVVTLVHQDDVYDPSYTEEVLNRLNRAKRPLICFTDYYEVRNDQKVFADSNKNLRIKELALAPLRLSCFENSRWVRRRILSICDPICCPSVTYVKPNLPEVLFEAHFKSDLDWEAWEKLSRLVGGFCYVHKPLMGHRIHEESTTTQVIGDHNGRSSEDLEMYLKFWPPFIAKWINKMYSAGQDSNKMT